jgi:outer membrane protein assembly factor BamB
MRLCQLALLVVPIAIAGLPQFCHADDWPQFRGPNCSGISQEQRPLPTTFSTTENVRWTADVGQGVGGAAIASGRVFVSGMTADDTVSLFAFDAASGQQLWRRDWPAGALPEIHQVNSHASSTPAADAERVYFYYINLGLIALDAKTGEIAWRQPLPGPFFVFKWGAGMSPVLYRDLVLFCQDDDLAPALYAFDRASGKLRWKDERLDMAVNYSHPIINTVDGHDEIVVAGTGLLIGYDPADGKRKWHARTLLRNIKTTPVSADGVVYVSLQSSGIANQWLVAVDQADTGNKDGRLDKAEIQAFAGMTPVPESFLRRTFDRGDINHDGFLEGEELDRAFLSPDNFAGARYSALGSSAADELIVAVRGGGTGDVTQPHLLWKHDTKHTDHIVSPLVSHGRILLIKSGGICTVFGTADGPPLSKPRRVANATNYFASPVLGDGKIYLAGENGKIAVLRNVESYEELAVNDVGASIVATPAIADGALWVRTRDKLLSFSLPLP